MHIIYIYYGVVGYLLSPHHANEASLNKVTRRPVLPSLVYVLLVIRRGL